MIGEIKNGLLYLLLWLSSGVSTDAAATVEMPNFSSIAWNERTYKTALPLSYGNVTIDIFSQGDEKVESILIEFLDKKILVPDEELIDIEFLGNPDLAIVDKGEKNEKLQVLFEYGVPIKIQLESSSSCNGICYNWVRKILVITINKKGEFKIAKTSTR